MSYQILGLRDYVHARTQKLSKRQCFFEKNWRVDDISKIFSNPDAILEKIPEPERRNIYFTVADCFDGPDARKMKEQWVIPFDIDHLGLETDIHDKISEHCLRVLQLSCATLGVDASRVACIFSGNGMQFFVKMTHPILNEEYFSTQRDVYKLVCEKIQAVLTLNHIAGKVDASVFDGARLMRMPNTGNEKPSGRKWAFVVHPLLEGQPFNLQDVIGDSVVKKADNIDPAAWKQKHNSPDQVGVLSGCGFLKWCKENPNKVEEHQWY